MKIQIIKYNKFSQQTIHVCQVCGVPEIVEGVEKKHFFLSI